MNLQLLRFRCGKEGTVSHTSAGGALGKSPHHVSSPLRSSVRMEECLWRDLGCMEKATGGGTGARLAAGAKFSSFFPPS